MKNLLLYLKVKEEENSKNFISYGKMLSKMVKNLTKEILQGHGGQRSVKIIYCIRNFLFIAKEQNKDVQELKKAAKYLLSLKKEFQNYLYSQVNWSNTKEIRNVANGLEELQKFLK